MVFFCQNMVEARPEEFPNLSERQIKILRFVVEEYSQTAAAVGSDTLDKKYQIGVSPATIRNEMNRLTEKGYLIQPHASAGRIPTPMGIKFYIKRLMEEKELPVTEEVKVKQQIWDAKGEIGRLMREVTHALANQTHMLALAATDQGKIYHAGYANILDVPEFFDIDLTKAVLNMIDEVNELMGIFNRALSEDPLQVLVGDDLGVAGLSSVGLVYTGFNLGGTAGKVGVLGPRRLDYAYVIPAVRHVGRLLAEIGEGW